MKTVEALKLMMIKSNIIKEYMQYIEVIRFDYVFNYKMVLRSFLLIWIIPTENDVLQKQLKEIIKDKEVIKKMMSYTNLFVEKQKHHKITKSFLTPKNWEDVFEIYSYMPNFYNLFTNDHEVIKSMRNLTIVFSFGDDKVLINENLIIENQQETYGVSDYYFRLLFYFILARIDFRLFKILEWYINEKKAKDFFKNKSNLEKAFDLEQVEKMIKNICIKE